MAADKLVDDGLLGAATEVQEDGCVSAGPVENRTNATGLHWRRERRMFAPLLGVGNNNKLVEFLGPFLQEDEGVSGYEAVCGTYTWGWDGCWLGLELYLKLTGGLIIFSPVF